MKLSKIIMLAGISLMPMFMNSCDDDNEYTPGNPPGKYDVSFEEESSNLAIGLSDETFEIKVVRTSGEGELTVPIEVLQKPDFFTVPSSVTFAAGETETTLDVAIGEGMENFVNYTFRLKIPEEYTNPYKAEAGSPLLNITVLKEDYKTYAIGVFTENVLFGQSWEQVLEYSEILDMYRFPDLIASGTHFYFKWNGLSDDDCELYFCDDEGNEVSVYETGYQHSTYGMISANFLYDTWTGFDASENTFYFPIEFTVSAGTFGDDYDTFTITQRY